MAGLNWVGSNLTGLLTIFSVVVGFLYLRQRDKTKSLETDLQLDENYDKVKEAKKETEHARKQADNSLDAFRNADAAYRRENGDK